MQRKLPFTESFRDRHGKTRYYFRRNRYSKRIPLPDPKTDWQAHLAAWQDAQNSDGQNHPLTHSVKIGSFAHLLALYQKSPEWVQLRQITKDTYESWFRGIIADYGHMPVRDLERRHIRLDLSDYTDSAGRHNRRLRGWKRLLGFAVDIEWIPASPASGIRSMKTAGGFKDWPEEMIKRYQDHWPMGASERLAFDLFLFTGQRLGDVAKMMRAQIETDKTGQGWIRVKQGKTGAMLEIPLHPQLAKSIEAMELTSLYLIAKPNGQPRDTKAMGNWFRASARAAGIPTGYSAHGLRKSATRRLIEAGATEKEAQAITGHVTSNEVERYSKARDQRLLAKRAIDRLKK